MIRTLTDFRRSLLNIPFLDLPLIFSSDFGKAVVQQNYTNAVVETNQIASQTVLLLLNAFCLAMKQKQLQNC